jgi:hypothetical protein
MNRQTYQYINIPAERAIRVRLCDFAQSCARVQRLRHRVFTFASSFAHARTHRLGAWMDELQARDVGVLQDRYAISVACLGGRV